MNISLLTFPHHICSSSSKTLSTSTDRTTSHSSTEDKHVSNSEHMLLPSQRNPPYIFIPPRECSLRQHLLPIHHPSPPFHNHWKLRCFLHTTRTNQCTSTIRNHDRKKLHNDNLCCKRTLRTLRLRLGYCSHTIFAHPRPRPSRHDGDDDDLHRGNHHLRRQEGGERRCMIASC